jgi:hypothetical protein
MDDTQLSLGVAASVVLDGNGNGSVTVGPSMSAERWEVTSVVVTIPNATLIPTATIYNGPIGNSNRIAFTYVGSGDTAGGGNSVVLGSGQFLSVEWIGGDSLATATVTLQGNRYLRGQRAY